jgi:hypothetical protein
MVDDKKESGLTMDTVTSNNPFNFPIILPNYQRTKLIDVNRRPLKTVFHGCDMNAVLKRAREALPFPDDCFVFPTLDKEVAVFELL